MTATSDMKTSPESMTKPRYEVLTWDTDLQEFTPQPGVSPGPYSQFGLRRALRILAEMGYDIKRSFVPSVLVQRIPETRA